ncbi:MAG: hypothetical protein IIX43_05285, partial [Bacteroidales bacterium]|nr:hypothetical protein [Bacteroidales bacterium]
MAKIVKRLALLMLMLPFVACEETNYEADEFVGKKTISQLSTDNFLTFDSFAVRREQARRDSPQKGVLMNKNPNLNDRDEEEVYTPSS